MITLTAKERKERPLTRGVLDYFPNALMEVAYASYIGNEQHNPGQPLHWAKEKSTDHADCILRHLADRGTRDTDGVRHRAKVAWRALADLEIELLAEDAEMSYEDYIEALKGQAEAEAASNEAFLAPLRGKPEVQIQQQLARPIAYDDIKLPR